MVKDWVKEAALDIQRIDNPKVVEICDAIERHSPFKEGVVYMPVPRCDGCKYWGATEKSDGRECERTWKLDAEGMWPELYDRVFTSARFGCIQWKAKS